MNQEEQRGDHLEETLRIVLQAQPGIRLALLFGSLARDNAHIRSDLDLAIDRGHPLTARNKMELIAELASRIGRAVDLIDLRTVGEPLLGQILRYGKRILGTPGDYANLLYKHFCDQADFLPYRNRILAERRQAWIGK